MSDREQIVKRIRAFLARAADAASTEAEALKAARKAAQLMDKHGLTSAEIEDANSIGGYSCADIHVPTVWQQPIHTSIAVAVANYTGTCCFVRRRKPLRDIRVAFYGELADVLFAEWLQCSLADFVIAGCQQHTEQLKLGRKELNDHRFGYLVSAGHRISERLRELIAERNRDRQSSNLPALLDKSAAAKNALLATGAQFNPAKPPKQKVAPGSAIDAGKARGDAANFARGVDAQTPATRLTSAA